MAFVPWIAGDNGEQPQVYMCAPLATAAGPGGWWALCGVGRHHHDMRMIITPPSSGKAQAPITLTHLPCIQLTPVFCSRRARLRMRSVNVTCSRLLLTPCAGVGRHFWFRSRNGMAVGLYHGCVPRSVLSEYARCRHLLCEPNAFECGARIKRDATMCAPVDTRLRHLAEVLGRSHSFCMPASYFRYRRRPIEPSATAGSVALLVHSPQRS